MEVSLKKLKASWSVVMLCCSYYSQINTKISWDGKVKGKLGYSEHEILKFKILREISKKNTTITAWNFWRPDFTLLEDLLVRILWKTSLKGKGAQVSWLIFRDNCFNAQGWSIPICKN